MKNFLLSVLLGSTLCSILVPASSAFAMESMRQTMATKLREAQEKLTTMQATLSEFTDCVLKGNCSSDKQQKLSTVLKASAVAIGIIILAIVTAVAASKIASTQQPTSLPALATQPGTPTTYPEAHVVAESAVTQPKLDNPVVFYQAIVTGNTSLINKILDAGYLKIDAPLANDLTPLSTAAKFGKVEVIKLLLDRGAHTQLDSAVRGQVSPDIMKLIATYKQKGDITAQPSATIPPALKSPIVFYQAIVTGNTDLVNKILDAGYLQIDAPLANDLTPLSTAAQFGKVEVIKLLLNRGAHTQLDSAVRGQVSPDIMKLIATYKHRG